MTDPHPYDDDSDPPDAPDPGPFGDHWENEGSEDAAFTGDGEGDDGD